MGGDGQMNPDELKKICKPIVYQNIYYSKGNRLSHKEAWKRIPTLRIIGNIILTFMTRMCSGYWNINDTQTGFTAISIDTLHKLDLDNIYTYYGYPNDILVKLNILECKIHEVDVESIYHKEMKSKMNIWKVIPKISVLLTALFFPQIGKKIFT